MSSQNVSPALVRLVLLTAVIVTTACSDGKSAASSAPGNSSGSDVNADPGTDSNPIVGVTDQQPPAADAPEANAPEMPSADEVLGVPVLLRLQPENDDEGILDFTLNPAGTEIAVLFTGTFMDTSRLTIYNVNSGERLRDITEGRDPGAQPGNGGMFWADNNQLTVTYRPSVLVDPTVDWTTWDAGTGALLQTMPRSGTCARASSTSARFDPGRNRLVARNSATLDSQTLEGGLCRIDLNTYSFEHFQVVEHPGESPREFDLTPDGEEFFATYRVRPEDLTNFDPELNFDVTRVYDTENFQLQRTIPTDQFEDPRLNSIIFAGENYTLFRDSGRARLLPANTVLDISFEDVITSSNGNVVAFERRSGSFDSDVAINLPGATLIGTLPDNYSFFSASISATGSTGAFLVPGNPAVLEVVDLSNTTAIPFQ